DLPAVAGVADAGGPVHREPDVLVAGDRGLARVDAHPDTQLDSLGPVVGGEGTLRRHGRTAGGPRPAERDEERVAVRVELLPDRERPAWAGVAVSGGPVHREPDVLVAGDRGPARVDAHPDTQLDSLGPVVGGEGTLRRHGRTDGGPRPAERDEERVAVRVELL